MDLGAARRHREVGLVGGEDHAAVDGAHPGVDAHAVAAALEVAEDAEAAAGGSDREVHRGIEADAGGGVTFVEGATGRQAIGLVVDTVSEIASRIDRGVVAHHHGVSP